MLDFNEYSRFCQAQAVGGRKNIDTAIRPRPRYPGAEPHATQYARNQLLKFLPVERSNLALDQLFRLGNVLLQDILLRYLLKVGGCVQRDRLD